MEYINKYVWFQEGPGIRKKQYTENGVKLLNVANLINGKIDLSTSKRYISKNEAYGKYKHFLVDEGDFIIASSGIQVNYFDKKMGLITKDQLPLCMNTSTIRFKTLDKNKLDIRYFMYFMKSEQFKLQLKKLITGSAQLNFGPSHLKKVKISVPELKIQKEYISKLDNITKIIDIKNKQIMQLNQLIKSLFFKMFNNKIQFPRELLKNNIEEMFIGPFGSDLKNEFFVDKKSSYCVVYEQKHAINKYIGDFRYINKDKYNELKRFEIQPEDIIVSCRGTIGETYVIPKNSPLGIMHPSIMKIRLKKDKYNSIFFNEMISNYLYENAEKNNGGIIKMAIKASDLANTAFIRPDIKEQENYLKLKQQIDKQKFEIQNSLNKMKALYETLMNKYFG